MIELRGLQKVIAQNPIVSIEDLTVGSGEIAAIFGPVGSGKAVLAKLLMGQITPTVGSVRIAGVDPARDQVQFSRLVGVLFVEDSLYLSQSPRANLLFQCRLRGLPKSRVNEILTQVGLADQAHAKVDKLPSGLARRLSFGRAIIHSPRVLLLLEPFARCDEASIDLLGELMGQLAKEGASVLILAEDNAHLETLCDSIYVLNQGRIVDSYKPGEVQEDAIPLKIPVRLEGRVALVNLGEILFADAKEGRTFLQTLEGRLPTQFTLTELEDRLARRGFFRAHRSYLVNLQHVKEVIPFTRNSFSLRLDDQEGTLIPLSKSAASELRDLLGY